MATMSTTSNAHRTKRDDEPMEDTYEPRLNNLIDDTEVFPRKKFKIGKELMDPHKEKLIHLLEAHLDVFAWDMLDLLAVNPSVITHKLNVIPGSKSVK